MQGEWEKGKFAHAYISARMLTRKQILSKRQHSVSAREPRNDCMLCSHIQPSLGARVRGEAVCSYTVCVQRKERQHQ